MSGDSAWRLSSAVCIGVGAFALVAARGCAPSSPGGNGGTDVSPLSADAGDDQRIVATATSAQIVLSASGSTADATAEVTYVWTDSAGAEIGRGEQITTILPVGTFTLTLIATDSFGQSDSDTVIVTVIDPNTAFVLEVQIVGSGTTEPPAGTISAQAGDTIDLSATPFADWRFARWNGDIDTTLADTSIFIDDDKTVVAEFEPIPVSSVPLFYAPFAPGESRTVNQGNDGQFSHQGKFAWDFGMPIGTPVLATSAGRVIYVEEDVPNNSDGAVLEPDQPANVVVMDVGGGRMALYAHLDLIGAKPLAGQRVARGQCIGLSGNSGYSTGPHLHYELLDVNQVSVSSGFVESPEPDGIAAEGEVLTSMNELELASVDDFVESTLPTDAFATSAVELFEPTIPAFFLETGTSYTLRGRVTDSSNAVCVALSDFNGVATSLCDQTIGFVDRTGTFEIDFVIPPGTEGLFLIGVITGTNGVLGTVSIPVNVGPSADFNAVPVAVAEQPGDRSLSCGQTGELFGFESSDDDGDALTYQWVQVTGPTAIIDDANEANTTFMWESTPGQRLLFQLTVSDGQSVSLPAAVEYVTDCG